MLAADLRPSFAGFEIAPLFAHSDRVVMVTAVATDVRLCHQLRSHRAEIDELVADRGGVLLRGFKVEDREFSDVAALLCRPLPYMYRSTPRTSLGAGVYTATEYPANQTIPVHCENAYQRDWPLRVIFLCDRPPTSRGETPLADVARATDAIDPAIVRRFQDRGVMYVRSYHPGIDLPWQTVFQTDDRDVVARYCAAHGIAWEWRGESLHTRQVCHATAMHPRTGRLLWFNQAHLFHVSSHPPAVRDALLSVYAPDELPRNALFGDGSEIDTAELDAVRAAFDAHTMMFPWQRGDVLVLDNMAIAHGRRPFDGPRRVLVAMGDNYALRHAAH
ncbi:MAG TPA: TauD/TfdA family dioxygenase [Kofleriaceae bacterium]|nr:TauD/TfdA family dioxygenase [Kofleriaceae bacterium]